MKQKYTLIILLLFLFCSLSGYAQRRDMRAFDHWAASVDVGTAGFGIQGATSLAPNFALRGGLSVLPFDYSYTYEGYGDGEHVRDFEVPLKAKVDMFNAKLLVDFFPKRDSRFHFTAGFLLGSTKIIKVSGKSDLLDELPIEIGDIWIRPDDAGNVAAWIKTNAIKPYFGFGLGRTIPRQRVGFKFEMGAIYQGSPKVGTNNTILSDLADLKEPEDDLNKFLKDYFKFYPYISFQLTFKVFCK